MGNPKAVANREDVHFRVLRLVEQRPGLSQRDIANNLGVSLGAVNYAVRALLDRGHMKLANFKASKNKLGYVYVLTPEGIAHRASLALRFIERKMAEFEAIEAELAELMEEFVELCPETRGAAASGGVAPEKPSTGEASPAGTAAERD
jgi:EPS-associated MarR family transcriptional regulator